MTTLLEGTITFFFSDIEGSTQLWEHHPDHMQAALRRHDELMRAAIETHGGQIFKTAGDAFRVAFGNAPDALRAALAGQGALAAEDWPSEIGTIRVRMALHTGTAETRDDDYFGPTLNRVARLESAGHGGQILVSQVAEGLLRDSLPDGVSLLDMGAHRLKDLLRPEQIYQVNAPGLPTEFPALNTLDSKMHNLPAQTTPFIGRERERVALVNLMQREDVRLATLTGPGGTGKTRLSQQTAAELMDDYGDGVWFVDLSTVMDSELVASSIAKTLDVSEEANQPVVDTLCDHFSEKRCLLVLDNFEQVVDAAPDVSRILGSSPGVKAMVSSREVLRVSGEHVFLVPPLGLPEAGQRHQTAAMLAQYEAVRLFTGRAQAANPTFELTEDNAAQVAEICRRLDGLPLAIELAAARSRMLKPEAILKQFDNRLKALTGGARDLPERQQTLRGAIDWSYDLLDEDERKLFARLSVFTGGWSVEAAETVCGEGLALDVLNGLESLLDKSLIRQVEGVEGDLRFAMLETIREYAAWQLTESGAAGDVHWRHMEFFVELVNSMISQTSDLAGAIMYLAEVVAIEYPNTQAAMRWAQDEAGAGRRAALERIARITFPMMQYYLARRRTHEGLVWAEKSLSYFAEDDDSLEHGLLLAGSASLGITSDGDINLLRQRNNRAVEILRQHDDVIGLGFALLGKGVSANLQDDFEVATAALQEAESLFAEHGIFVMAATISFQLGDILLGQGLFDEAEAKYNHVLRMTAERNDEGFMYVQMHNNLGEVARCRDDYATAREQYDIAYKGITERGFTGDMARLNHNMAYVSLYDGEKQQAEQYARESLAEFQTETLDRGLAEGLAVMGAIALAQGNPERGLTLLAASQQFFDAAQIMRWPADRSEVESAFEQARSVLDEETFAVVEARGRALTLDEAVKLALRGDDN